MAEQKYWVCLGHGLSRDKPHYAQSLMDSENWRDSALRDDSVAVVIELIFNPKTGGVSSVILKNKEKNNYEF